MSKIICDYCKYADVESQKCYVGGWDKCRGDLFVDTRIATDAANFARFVDEKCGTENTALFIQGNTSITYEQLYDIYDTRRNILEQTLRVEKRDIKPNSNKYSIVINIGANDYEPKSLGDFLVYSKLPRLLKESGYKAVYLSAYTPFRNEGIEELIMCNPYIDGVVDIKPLDNINIDMLFANNKDNQRNIMGLIHEAYGVQNDEMLIPEIYYRPKVVEEYLGKIIYDPNCHTNLCGVTLENITKYFSENNVKIDYQLKPRERFNVVLPNVPIIESTSIFNWIDILYSAMSTYSLFTGINPLMAGYEKNHTVLYVEGKEGYADYLKFDNINYVSL